MAPGNAPISIPTGDVTMANGATDSQAWDGGRSPGRGGDLPRRSSRSRSPGRGNADDRGCVSTLHPFTGLIFIIPPAVMAEDRILATIFMFRV